MRDTHGKGHLQAEPWTAKIKISERFIKSFLCFQDRLHFVICNIYNMNSVYIR